MVPRRAVKIFTAGPPPGPHGRRAYCRSAALLSCCPHYTDVAEIKEERERLFHINLIDPFKLIVLDNNNFEYSILVSSYEYIEYIL